MKDIEKVILGIGSNEKIKFEVMIRKPSFLQRLKREKSRIYEVNRYTTLSQNEKITKILIDIPEVVSFESDSEVLLLNIEYMSKHTQKILKIISILTGEKDLKFLGQNLESQDFLNIVMTMFEMLDFKSFMSSIHLIRNKGSLKN